MFDFYDILISMGIGFLVGMTGTIILVWWDCRRKPETGIYGERI